MTPADWTWVLGCESLGRHQRRARLRSDPARTGRRTRSQHGLNGRLAYIGAGSMGVYRVSKHAVVALSDLLQISLTVRCANIGVSVFCPAWVRTNISDSIRSRPAEYPATAPEPTRQAQPPSSMSGTVGNGNCASRYRRRRRRRDQNATLLCAYPSRCGEGHALGLAVAEDRRHP